jgi:hypothetical protein
VQSKEALALVGANDSAVVRLALDGAGVEIDSTAGASQPAPPPCQHGGGCTLPDRREEKYAPESIVGEVGQAAGFATAAAVAIVVLRPVRLAYQPPASSIFLSERTSH